MLATLLETRPVTGRDTCYIFHCPAIAQTARPGQFVELKLTEGFQTPFLRRPISLFDTDGKETFSLLVRSVGQGTEWMRTWTPGRTVDVLGPLGRSFRWTPDMRTCVLVAGGIGLAPMGLLARRLLEGGLRVRLLFSPRRDHQLLEALPLRRRLEIAESENRATLTAAMEPLLDGADILFACGPEGLLETAARAAAAHGVPSQLSMERRMACGIGICLGCAVAIRSGEHLTYQKVCKDGPVFAGEEVAFHEEP